jgi:ribose transport system ATP-binding protein
MGAGRTEVARAIFGADKIDSGEILVHGNKVSIQSPADAVKHGIGYLSEDRKHFGLATGMSVASNIVLATMKRFLSGQFFLKQSVIRETATVSSSSSTSRRLRWNRRSRFLSGGNQQKVVIAKWLVRDCEILFFDEPTRGIDVGAKSEIYKLLNTWPQQGRAIVMISSELPEVLRLSNRILVMCEGRITGELKAGRSDAGKHHAPTPRSAKPCSPTNFIRIRHVYYDHYHDQGNARDRQRCCSARTLGRNCWPSPA